MSETPPPQFVAYPRGTGPEQYGSADKLEALSDGYFNLNWVFVATIAMSLIARAIIATSPEAIWLVIGGLFLAEVAITYPFNKKIGFGKGWSDASVIVASLIMGLNVFCCGIVGFIVMQQIAYGEMKKYGLKSSFLGLKKKTVRAAIERLRQVESQAARLQ